MKDEQAFETEIRAKGNTAPRLTPAMIDAQLAGEQYQVFPGRTLSFVGPHTR